MSLTIKCNSDGCNSFITLSSLDKEDYLDALECSDRGPWAEEGGKHYCYGCNQEERRMAQQDEDIIRENRVEMPRGYSFGQVSFE